MSKVEYIDTIRRYCGRVGIAGAVQSPCQECGGMHPPLKDQDQCFHFVECSEGDGKHGHPCELGVNHDDDCSVLDCA